jgi:hypothetical protein
MITAVLLLVTVQEVRQLQSLVQRRQLHSDQASAGPAQERARAVQGQQWPLRR